MIINDLSKDNYFAFNDIWVKVGELPSNVTYVTLEIDNITDPQNVISITAIRMYPSPKKEVSFNIAYPIRNLFHRIDHTLEIPNTRQLFHIKLTSTLSDGGKLETEIQKQFIYGGVRKTGLNDWYMKNGDTFLIGNLQVFDGMPMPVLPIRLDLAGRVETFYPFQNIIRSRYRSCSTYVVKFLNSLGGFQYYVFESAQFRTRAKAGKLLTRRTYSLKEDGFGQEHTSTTSTVEFNVGVNDMNFDALKELVNSEMVYLWNFSTNPDLERQWTRLQVDDNTLEHTSFSPQSDNKISFVLQEFVNL